MVAKPDSLCGSRLARVEFFSYRLQPCLDGLVFGAGRFCGNYDVRGLDAMLRQWLDEGAVSLPAGACGASGFRTNLEYRLVVRASREWSEENGVAVNGSRVVGVSPVLRNQNEPQAILVGDCQVGEFGVEFGVIVTCILEDYHRDRIGVPPSVGHLPQNIEKQFERGIRVMYDQLSVKLDYDGMERVNQILSEELCRGRSVLLVGEPNTGKTSLLGGVVVALRCAGEDVEWLDAGLARGDEKRFGRVLDALRQGNPAGVLAVDHLPIDVAFSVAPGPTKAVIEAVSMDPEGLGSVPRECLRRFHLVAACRRGARGEPPVVAVAALV